MEVNDIDAETIIQVLRRNTEPKNGLTQAELDEYWEGLLKEIKTGGKHDASEATDH